MHAVNFFFSFQMVYKNIFFLVVLLMDFLHLASTISDLSCEMVRRQQIHLVLE
ncbi:hypothetical protein OIU77_009200 [Salix suchowensis]|uniref:Uncharacterized protein n=1 Tax=Salix suchowensis TaxID=1278906 RepID=A0ABQ9ADI2_9ROSI|nr:hypothetical protein OIU77_009200 [Salix suchowensis]